MCHSGIVRHNSFVRHSGFACRGGFICRRFRCRKYFVCRGGFMRGSVFRHRNSFTGRSSLICRNGFFGRRLRGVGRSAVPDTVFGKHPAKHPLKNGALNGLGNKFRKAFVTEHFPGSADGICGQGNHRQIPINTVVDFPDSLQGFHAVKSRHHVVEEDNVVGYGGAFFNGFLSA